MRYFGQFRVLFTFMSGNHRGPQAMHYIAFYTFNEYTDFALKCQKIYTPWFSKEK